MTKEDLKIKIENYLSRITYLNDCFKLFKRMNELQREFISEINKFPAFYQISKKSYIYIIFIELYKLYDRESKTGLLKLLNICEANSNLFLKEYINTITYDIKNKETYKILVDIKKDILDFKENISKYDKIINEIKAQRDKFYANLDKEFENNPSLLLEKYPVNFQDVEDLIEFASKVCNTLLKDLCRSSWVTSTNNWNDIENILEIIRQYNLEEDKKYNI